MRFIKENSVGIFMSRIEVQEAGGGSEDSEAINGSAVSSPEEAMMGRMGILVVCRFERLLVEEQVRNLSTIVCIGVCAYLVRYIV